MTQEIMNALVPQKLKEIEDTYSVTVLWAVESGSRAWGFASPDSDFDVRFIYKRSPADYLKLNPDRDVIELPVDDTWDVSGWDLDKTLKLLQKSNPTLFEWMNSPIKYYGADFPQRMEPLLKEYFCEERMLYHYLNTAKSNIKNFLSGDSVKPKKYFYALRPILACIWIRAYHSAPPVLFDELCRAVLPENMKAATVRLLDLKVNGSEKMEIPPIKEMHEFLDEQVKELDSYLKQLTYAAPLQWDSLNEFFWNEIHREEF